MRKQLINICLSALFAIGSFSSAEAAYMNNGYDNAHSLGMGGVSVAIADDYQALYRNPAGLGLQKKTTYSVITPTFARNSDFSDVNDSIGALSDADSATSRSDNYRKLQSVMGKTGYQEWSDSAYYINEHGFGLSILYDNSETYSVENPINPRVNSSVYKDTFFTGSYARAFVDDDTNLFKEKATGWWGATVKIGSRKMTESSYFARDFAALTPSAVKDTDKTGMAFDADLGALYQLQSPMKPTIGAFIGNVLAAKFSDEAGSLRRHYSIGASIKPLTGPTERTEKLTLAAEYYDDGAHVNALNKVRLGMQFKLTENFSLLAGVKGGYMTGGIDFNWNDVTITASTYAEELGERPGDRESRRYAVDASLRF